MNKFLISRGFSPLPTSQRTPDVVAYVRYGRGGQRTIKAWYSIERNVWQVQLANNSIVAAGFVLRPNDQKIFRDAVRKAIGERP